MKIILKAISFLKKQEVFYFYRIFGSREPGYFLKYSIMKKLITLISMAFVCANVFSQTTVTYTQLTGNYPTTWTSGTAGAFDNAGSEVGMYAHDTGSKQVVSWRKFKTAGDNSGSDRSLQVGDKFTITVAATRAYGRIGVALLCSPTSTGSYADRENNYAISINLDGNAYTGSGFGVWYIRYAGGATSAASFGGNGFNTFNDFKFEFTLTAPNRMNVSITNIDASTTDNFYDIQLNNSNITDYSIYLDDDYNGTEKKNIYWKQATTVVNTGALNIGQSNNSFTVSGIISNGLDANSTATNSLNNSLTKNGTGTVTLSASNTYVGSTTISGGVLNIQNASALGTIAGSTTVSGSTALEIQGGISTAEPLTIGGTGIGSTGAIRNISGSNNITATVQLNAESYIQSDAGTLTLSATNAINGTNHSLTLKGAGDGIVSGTITTGSGTLSKSNGGKWTLSGANTYTGATSITGGVLNIQNATALGTTSGGVTVSAALELQNNITVGNESLSLTGGGISSNGALRNISGTNEYQGSITLTGNTIIQCDAGTLNLTNANTITGTFTLNLEGAGNINITGIISTSTGTLTKIDGGTVTLTGVNTYTGLTTVTGGILILANTSGNTIPATNNITVSGGTLRISENQTINNLTLSGGTLLIDAGKTLTINGTYNAGSSTSTVTNNGTLILNSTSNFPGSNAAVTAGFNNLNINAAITLNNNLTVEGIFNLIGGTFDVNNKTLTLNNAVAATSGTLTSSTTGTVIYNQSADGQNVLAGQYGFLTFSNFNKTLASSGTIYINGLNVCFTPGSATSHTIAGSTIEFNRAGAQNVPSFTYNNLNISTSNTKTLTTSINIDGNLTISSSATLASGGNTINIKGNWSNYGTGGFTESTGTVNFNGTGAQSINTTGGENFYVLQKSGSGTLTLLSNVNVAGGGIADLNISSGILDAGTNTLDGTASLTMSGGLLKLGKLSVTLPEFSGSYILSGSSTIELNGAGDQILRGSKSYANLSFSNSGTKTLTSAIGTPSNTISGTVLISDAAILNVSNNTFGSATTNLTMTGTSQFIVAGSNIKPDIGGTYSLGVGTTIEFAGNANLNPRVLSISYYNVIVSGTNVNTDGTGTGLTFQTDGTFTVKDGALFAFADPEGFSGTANTAINNTNSPSITLETNSTIGYRRADIQTVTNAMAYKNLRIGAAGTKTLAGAITVNGNLELNAGELADAGNIITVSGNILGTSIHSGAGKILMTGASVPTISGATIGNLELNNGGGFSLSGSPTINNVLTFTNGKLTMGTNSITLANSATTAITGYNSTNYFVTDGAGYVRRAVIGSGAYDFPVGTTSNYDPAIITWTGASGTTQLSTRFIAETLDDPTGLESNAYGYLETSEPDIPTPITEFLNNGYWEINSTGTGSPNNYQIDLTASGAGNLATYAQQHTIFKNSGVGPTGWAQAGEAEDLWGDADGVTAGYQYTLTPDPLHLQNTDVSGFSYFGIGRSEEYILPIVLTEFTAELIDADVILNWITASEVNNDYFTIERSMDGSIWNAIGQVNGAGSSSTVNHYDFTDKDAPGMVLYYRLKQTDFNGNYEYSPIRVVNNLGNEAYIIYGYYTLTGQKIESLENAPTGIYLQLSNKGNTKIFHNE